MFLTSDQKVEGSNPSGRTFLKAAEKWLNNHLSGAFFDFTYKLKVNRKEQNLAIFSLLFPSVGASVGAKDQMVPPVANSQKLEGLAWLI